jgi:hypothetical protein
LDLASFLAFTSALSKSSVTRSRLIRPLRNPPRETPRTG